MKTPNKKCKHKRQKIVVIESIVTCETTVIMCIDCKKRLTKPKIDC